MLARNLVVAPLEKRREILCLKFAKNCLKNDKVKDMFPIKKSKHKMKKRMEKRFKTKKNKTKRRQNSALPYMRKLLNDEYQKKQKMLKDLES